MTIMITVSEVIFIKVFIMFLLNVYIVVYYDRCIIV